MSWDLINNVFVQKMIIVFVCIILPLVPSYILFKYLPSKSAVTGPFRGHQIDFSGAAAVYIVMFISLLGGSQFWKIPPSDYEVWSVRGRLEGDNMESYRNIFHLTVEPKGYTVFTNGEFATRVIVPTKMSFPHLFFQNIDGNFKSFSVKLDTTNQLGLKVKRNNGLKEVVIKDPIPIYPVEEDTANGINAKPIQ